MQLRFNHREFAWRHDLDDTVVVYKFGGKLVLVLRGSARERFLDVVERQRDCSVGDKAVAHLARAGVLAQGEEP